MYFFFRFKQSFIAVTLSANGDRTDYSDYELGGYRTIEQGGKKILELGSNPNPVNKAVFRVHKGFSCTWTTIVRKTIGSPKNLKVCFKISFSMVKEAFPFDVFVFLYCRCSPCSVSGSRNLMWNANIDIRDIWSMWIYFPSPSRWEEKNTFFKLKIENIRRLTTSWKFKHVNMQSEKKFFRMYKNKLVCVTIEQTKTKLHHHQFYSVFFSSVKFIVRSQCACKHVCSRYVMSLVGLLKIWQNFDFNRNAIVAMHRTKRVLHSLSFV